MSGRTARPAFFVTPRGHRTYSRYTYPHGTVNTNNGVHKNTPVSSSAGEPASVPARHNGYATGRTSSYRAKSGVNIRDSVLPDSDSLAKGDILVDTVISLLLN